MKDLSTTTDVIITAAEASSTAHNFEEAWPYLAFSVVLVIGLVGTALKILGNQKG